MAEETAGRREQILGAAARLLRHYGFAKTTVADIAREAGVGVGTVYLEFSSKEEIVGALSSQSHTRVLEQMRAAAGGHGGHAERLRATLEARLRAIAQLCTDGEHGRDLVACRCPKVGEVQRRAREEQLALLAELLGAGQRAGELKVQRPAIMARVLLRLYDCYLELRSEHDEEDLAVTHQLILRGLLRR